MQPKNYRTTLYDHKLNPNLHSRNTLFSHFFNQERVLQEWRFKFERFYALSYDLIHFYCDFRTLSYGFELNPKFNHYIEILLIQAYRKICNHTLYTQNHYEKIFTFFVSYIYKKEFQAKQEKKKVTIQEIYELEHYYFHQVVLILNPPTPFFLIY